MLNKTSASHIKIFFMRKGTAQEQEKGNEEKNACYTLLTHLGVT